MISNRCARKSLLINCNSIISKNYSRFLVDSNDYNYKKRRKKDIFSGQRIRISTLSLFHCYNNKQ